MLYRCCLGLPGIQNFFAFFNNLPAVVFSEQSDVCLAHGSSQNGCQPLICILFTHETSLIKLIKIMMCFIAQSTEFPVGHRAHGDLRSRMYPHIRIASREPTADIQHGVLGIVAVDAIGTSQNRLAAAIWTAGRSALSSLLFLHW